MGETFKQIQRATSGIIKASDWCRIEQDTSGINYPTPSSIVIKTSGVNNSYASVSNGVIYLIAFANGLTTGSKRYVLQLANTMQEAANDAAFAYGQWSANSGLNVFGYVRFRTFSVPYSLTGATWDSFAASPPAFNNTLETLFLQSTTNQGSDILFAYGNLCTKILTGLGTIYGFAIDVKVSVTATNVLANLCFIRHSASLPTFQTGGGGISQYPYAVVLTP